jgi:hypothetical protein
MTKIMDGYLSRTSTEPGVFTEGAKKIYKDKLMSFRPGPSAKVATKNETA